MIVAACVSVLLIVMIALGFEIFLARLVAPGKTPKTEEDGK